AQMPFHFWLPNAMAAPTPVSAFLHSATMVKAGVYIMARMHPSFAGTGVWLWTLTIFGAVTAVFASIVALRQTDLKQALAYTTLMALGTLTMLLGHSSAYALTAFATFLVVHSFYKAALFLVVGAIDKQTGTREAALLGDLRGAMPMTAIIAALAALSMAGIPPFLGFIAKELMYAGAASSAASPLFVVLAALAANALMFAVAGIVAFRPFWRAPLEAGAPRRPHDDVPWPMLAGPLVLAVLGLLFGLLPGLAQSWLVHPTVTAVMGQPGLGRPLHLWAGFNLPLILSLATFIIGFVIYDRRELLRSRIAGAEARLISFDRGWDRFMDWLKDFAVWQTRIIQTGRLYDYLAVTFLTIVAAVIVALFRTGLPFPSLDIAGVGWMQLGIAGLIITGSITAAMSASRIAAISALAVVGIGVALIFITYGAPDVAITQLMIEVLVVVLLAVAMLRLPRLSEENHRPRPRDLGIAVATGSAFSLILLSVLSQGLDRRLTDYFEIASWPEAFGRNIVNVILVDFRALDTMGELTVVAIAALGAAALLRMKIIPPKGRGPDHASRRDAP
ncbi:MAG: proton-conducting transporter membrane subunit, partial [Paracoccus sp. (in: a-proteobacteria)]|nr:proton-conducting transporter membrane subunit [Paracoccus sp. (in: a-proteobacteria)]